MTDASSDPMAGTGIDTSVPHSARIWNYWLGGKDNYPVDRAAGDAWIALNPEITVVARTSRAFLNRSVSYVAGEEGVRQFLDVGTGLPTADNTHQVAQRVAPDARVVYVDHDPLVLAHARALLVGTPEGETRYLDADMRDPENLLASAREILDFDRPVALMFMQVLGHIGDLDEARSLVRDHVRAAVPGQLPDPQRGLQHRRRGLGQEGPGRVQRHRRGALHHPHPGRRSRACSRPRTSSGSSRGSSRFRSGGRIRRRGRHDRRRGAEPVDAYGGVVRKV